MSNFANEYPLTSLIALTTVAEYQAFLVKAGLVRKSEKFDAPQIIGNENFERAYRVQMNTLESLPVQLTGLALFAQLSGNDKLAAGMGGAYVLGRLLYAIGYYKDPKKRRLGFMLSLLSQAALVGGSAYYLAKKLC